MAQEKENDASREPLALMGLTLLAWGDVLKQAGDLVLPPQGAGAKVFQTVPGKHHRDMEPQARAWSHSGMSFHAKECPRTTELSINSDLH